FLLDMERVFERYLTAGITAAAAAADGYGVKAQHPVHVRALTAGQPDILMRPDVLVLRHDEPVLVLDAKWKDLPKNALIPEDLYQVLAYAQVLGLGRAVLVYAGRADRVREYALPGSTVRVEVRTVNVSGTADACRRSLQRLARALLSG